MGKPDSTSLPLDDIERRAQAFSGICVGCSPGNDAYRWATFADHLGMFGTPRHSGGSLLTKDVEFIAHAKDDILALVAALRGTEQPKDALDGLQPFIADVIRDELRECAYDEWTPESLAEEIIKRLRDNPTEQASGRIDATDEQIITLCKVYLAGVYGGFDHRPNDRAIDAMRSAVECAFNV